MYAFAVYGIGNLVCAVLKLNATLHLSKAQSVSGTQWLRTTVIFYLPWYVSMAGSSLKKVVVLVGRRIGN